MKKYLSGIMFSPAEKFPQWSSFIPLYVYFREYWIRRLRKTNRFPSQKAINHHRLFLTNLKIPDRKISKDGKFRKSFFPEITKRSTNIDTKKPWRKPKSYARISCANILPVLRIHSPLP